MAAGLLGRPRRRIGGLLLIPLVDVIFLLLTFFMLASSIDPFSLLTLDEYQSRRDGKGPSAAPAPQPAPDLVLAVAHGGVLANGEPVALGDFPARAAALRGQGLETVVVFTRPDATVQDIVSVLDALKKAAFRSVIIRSPGGALSGAADATARG